MRIIQGKAYLYVFPFFYVWISQGSAPNTMKTNRSME